MRVGILGLGMYLPPQVRQNDWWDRELVRTWAERRPPPPPLARSLTPGMSEVLAAMRAQAVDPFQGAVQRHVLADDETVLDLEDRAAHLALERAGVDAHSVDLLLTCSTPHDYELTNSACELHERLGLPRACFTLHTDGAQHAFLLQLTLAEAMIAAGQAHTALLVQSSGVSRLLDYTNPISPMFGDGATAVVVGAVGADRGILAATHHTDGRLPNTLVASVPGKRWFDDGRAVLHMADPAGMFDILVRTVDLSRESIEEVLRRAGLSAEDIDVFAMHQGQPWLRHLVQEHTRLAHARVVDTFAATGHLFGAFVPSTLAVAERDGVLRDGDLVVIAGGGNGMTYGAAVVRWGRA